MSRFPFASRDPLLDQLIQARIGDRPYAIFFSTGEGRFLPRHPEIEEQSGYVLTGDGACSFYALGPDESGEPALTTWRPSTINADWTRASEYREARESLGLP